MSTPTRSRDIRIDTGILTHHDVEQKPAEAVNLDVVVNKPVTVDEIDWSTPVTKSKDELVLEWSDNDDDNDDEDGEEEKTVEKPKIVKQESVESEKSKSDTKACNLDVMAQQLKFVACLKILMEELSTLATGYEVDGGELRYHLYLWLEREVDALRHLCNYSSKDSLVVQCKYYTVHTRLNYLNYKKKKNDRTSLVYYPSYELKFFCFI